MMRRKRALIAFVCLGLFAVVSGSIAYLRKSKSLPLGEAPSIEYPSEKIAESARQQFLEGSFTLIHNVRNLPPPVLRGFTEAGGSRLVIANPGEDFQSTDVIYDSSQPRKRLIFAGVSGEKCFVYYEQGGIAHSYILHLFHFNSNSMKPVWKGYCPGGATNLEQLRSSLESGRCSQP
jgi:hypothetical protein